MYSSILQGPEVRGYSGNVARIWRDEVPVIICLRGCIDYWPIYIDVHGLNSVAVVERV